MATRVIVFPNGGCLFFLLLVFLIGGTPLLLGLARVGAFLFVGVLVAGAIGSWWLRNRMLPRMAAEAGARHDRFVKTFVELLVRLAEVDGALDRREVTVIRRFFQQELGYSDQRLLWVRDLIQEARGSTTSVEELCSRLTAEFDLQARFLVVEMLGRVARADGNVSAAESALLEEVIRRLGLAPFMGSFHGQWQQGFGGRGPGASAGPDRVAEALSVLGLKAGASAAEIKKAWRDLSKQHHPDRVTHLGEEFRKVAEERMRRINAAYDTLKEAGLAQ